MMSSFCKILIFIKLFAILFCTCYFLNIHSDFIQLLKLPLEYSVYLNWHRFSENVTGTEKRIVARQGHSRLLVYLGE